MKAKEASDLLEDLKDMLTEKSKEVQVLVNRRLALEKDFNKELDLELYAHFHDITK
jgi:hypothetical protein